MIGCRTGIGEIGQVEIVRIDPAEQGDASVPDRLSHRRHRIEDLFGLALASSALRGLRGPRLYGRAWFGREPSAVWRRPGPRVLGLIPAIPLAGLDENILRF